MTRGSGAIRGLFSFALAFFTRRGIITFVAAVGGKAMRRIGYAVASVLAAGFALPVPARAAMARAEAMQLYAAGGFPISANGDHPTNRCGAAASPRITFVDMNADGRKEALFIDAGPCYKPDGRWYAIATQAPDGRWRRILEGQGTVATTGTAFGGWFVLSTASGGRTGQLRFDGTVYRPAETVTAGAPPRPQAAPRGPVTGDAAIFAAAGFRQVHGRWESGCNDGNDDGATYEPGRIDQRRDLNGDGHPDAVIVEGGLFCYGNTGAAFWIVAGQANGGWKLMANEVGIPDFKAARGVGGWPDIEVGGPGFCFPVIRWNGAVYARNRLEYDGKPCKPPR